MLALQADGMRPSVCVVLVLDADGYIRSKL